MNTECLAFQGKLSKTQERDYLGDTTNYKLNSLNTEHLVLNTIFWSTF